MEITQQADYAVRAVLDLALSPPGERVTSSDVATRQSIPLPFLSKILARLAAVGLVNTQRGVNGGIRLARLPQEISLLDVIEAIDGPITINRSIPMAGNFTRLDTNCLQPVWLDLRSEIRTRLKNITFDQLASAEQVKVPAKDRQEVKLYASAD